MRRRTDNIGWRIFLTPKAYGWVEYQRKKGYEKWIISNLDNWKNWIIGFSFIVSLLVSIFALIKIWTDLPHFIIFLFP